VRGARGTRGRGPGKGRGVSLQHKTHVRHVNFHDSFHTAGVNRLVYVYRQTLTRIPALVVESSKLCVQAIGFVGFYWTTSWEKKACLEDVYADRLEPATSGSPVHGVINPMVKALPVAVSVGVNVDGDSSDSGHI
jgi:hypothetical protein